MELFFHLKHSYAAFPPNQGCQGDIHKNISHNYYRIIQYKQVNKHRWNQGRRPITVIGGMPNELKKSSPEGGEYR